MLSYSAILKQSYAITARFPVLWLFGLFVVGGFNLNFLHFQDIPVDQVGRQFNPGELAVFFQNNPGSLAILSLSVLVFSLLFLLVTNWSRVMLVLLIHGIVEKDGTELKKSVRASTASLKAVTAVSVLTTSAIVAAAAVLLGPALLVQSGDLKMLLLPLGVVLLLPLVFSISCVNIFTSYFLVLYRQPLGKALHQSMDFFASKWPEILGMALLLMAIYIFCFFVGVSLILITDGLFRALLEYGAGFHIFPESAMIVVPRLVSGLAIWILAAILNVFINTALLLLFRELVKPLETPESIMGTPAAARTAIL